MYTRFFALFRAFDALTGVFSLCYRLDLRFKERANVISFPLLKKLFIPSRNKGRFCVHLLYEIHFHLFKNSERFKYPSSKEFVSCLEE